MMYLWASYEKNVKPFFTSLNSMKKGVGSGTRSNSQSSGSGDLDPHRNVTDPQYCFPQYLVKSKVQRRL
jgi:hypothetical protein